MGQKRIIDIQAILNDPEIIDSLNFDGVLVYQYLWSIAEDSGCFEMNIEALYYRLGYVQTKIKIKRFRAILQTLIESGKVIPYDANGKPYGCIKNFLKYQTRKFPGPPMLPLPEWIAWHPKSKNTPNQHYSLDVDSFNARSNVRSNVRSLGEEWGGEKRRGNKYDESFEKFWTVYPKKVARPAAQKAWRGLKPNDELVEVIIANVVERCKSPEWRNNGGEFIPNPHNYLKHKRWEDEGIKVEDWRNK